NKEGRLVPGGLAGLAEAYASWGNYFAGLEGNQETALSYFVEEFELHPELKREYIIPYLTAIAAIRRAEGRDIILRELDDLGKKNDLSEEELTMMVGWYSQLNQTEKAQRYSALIREKFPQGNFIQNERFREFYEITDVSQKIALMKKFREDFPESDIIPAMHIYVCLAYRDNGQYAQIKEYLEKVPEEVNWSLYNNIAWTMAKEGADLELAAELAAKGVELVEKQKEDPKGERPSYITEREWKEQMDTGLAMVLDTYGFILLKLDRAEEALPPLEEASLLSQGQNLEINERYSEALVQSRSFEKAVSEIGKLIEEGQSTPKIKDLFRQAYLEFTGDQKGVSAQLLKLERIAKKKMRAELKETMIDFPAPDFTLEDLDGQPVSLADFRGKIVILDFWATWCDPCKESFPGMKLVVEKFKDDENIRFLFINSWERVENWKKNASDFMSENNYPFHVLLDTQNRVITDFEVDSIPTKFIIDRKGKIRFKSVGYSGRTDKLVEELSLMIEILR
ncbi:MAG: redoxin domain-containing protein, partial [Candidatus Aminicenantes bacterium]